MGFLTVGSSSTHNLTERFYKKKPQQNKKKKKTQNRAMQKKQKQKTRTSTNKQKKTHTHAHTKLWIYSNKQMMLCTRFLLLDFLSYLFVCMDLLLPLH